TATSPTSTRERILKAAFEEFHRHGFQGGSLNHIIEEAGLTKGAVFHHFASKQVLGYAIVDEIIWPLFEAKWLVPLADSGGDPQGLIRLVLSIAEEESSSGTLIQGCPLNNLAQEMSPLDEGFRLRLEKVYSAWRKSLADALSRGIQAGKVRRDIEPA